MISTFPLQLDLGASSVPHAVFDLIHLVLLLIGGYFAMKAFGAGERGSKFAWGFTLYAIGEISYIGYHVGVTTFLLSHTVSEVLVIIGIILIGTGLRDEGILPA